MVRQTGQQPDRRHLHHQKKPQANWENSSSILPVTKMRLIMGAEEWVPLGACEAGYYASIELPATSLDEMQP